MHAGCYLLTYSPAGASLVGYQGTFRIEDAGSGLIASADLYQRDVVPFEPSPDEPPSDETPPALMLASLPDPAAGIPIFPIGNYRFYLHVTQIASTEEGLRLAFETHAFVFNPVTLLDGSGTQWLREGTLTAQMTREPAPPAYPSPERYFEGDVANEEGTIVGRLSIGFVSPYFRKATIEIDRVPWSELPLDNGAGVSWRTIFDVVGWDITLAVSDSNIQEPEGGAWNKDDAHKAMDKNRDKVNLDTEWRYYILAVRQTSINQQGAERGIMFDEGGGPNRVPREGLLIASHWTIPDKTEWGLVRGMRIGTTVAYFRTAVHEVGHAMGLAHNDLDTRIMRSTEGIVATTTQAGAPPFPNIIKWSFAPDDERRLRHWPDLIVRPGGLPLGAGDRSPEIRIESDKCRLAVTPPGTSVPLGAPVPITVRLTNTRDGKAVAPPNLSLSSGFVRGQVIDRSGTVRTFSPLTVDETTGTTVMLKPGTFVESSLTLTVGSHGTLFPAPGNYRVVVEASWRDNGLSAFSVGETTVTVSDAMN